MKVLLDIDDHKASFVLELLTYFSFVKVKKLSDEKAEILSDIRDAVIEMNQIKKGTLTGRPVEDFLKEL